MPLGIYEKLLLYLDYMTRGYALQEKNSYGMTLGAVFDQLSKKFPFLSNSGFFTVKIQ